MSNPCIRCGKERIEGKSWEHRNNTSLITYTLTICPDPVCQKIVEKGIADKKEKSLKIAADRAKAKLERERLTGKIIP